MDFEILYRLYFRDVYRYVRGLSRDEHLAEEIAQETFARALGEYGATSMIAGYTPGRTATISTTVYQFWRTGNDELAFRWVMVNMAISFVVLMAVNLLEKNERQRRKGG